MNWIEAVMWAASLASLVGVVANIYKRRWCFHIWLFTNAAWTAYDIYKTAYPQAALMAVYVGLAVWGILAWKDASSKASSPAGGAAIPAGEAMIITIPKAWKAGSCPNRCPFFARTGDDVVGECTQGWTRPENAEKGESGFRLYPGPSCPGPGEYELVRKEEKHE